MIHQEVKTIEHKGIKVMVHVDYDNAIVSLVERQNYNSSGLQKKSYIFANRGLEYMNGWLAVLEALTFAVNQCKKDLERNLAEKSAFKEKEIVKNAFEIPNMIHKNMRSRKNSKR